ncbi:MAG: hypothetical protein AB7J32_26780 [Pseudonocardia sp.]
MPAHRSRHRASTPPVDAAGSLLDGPTDQWVPVRRDRALRRLTYVSCGLAAGTVVVTAGITAAIADLPAPAATTVAVDPAAAAAQLATPAPAARGTAPATSEPRPVPVLTPPPAAPEAVPSRRAGAPATTATRAKPTAERATDEESADNSATADTRSSGS